METLKKIFICAVLLTVVAVFSGCHTMHGAGQDIEQGGKEIKHAAE